MKSKHTLYHFLFWLAAYLFWVFVFRNGALVLTHAATIQFCYLVFIAGNFYFNRLFTVPHLLDKKKYLQFALCFMGGIVAGAVIRVPVSWLVGKYLFGADMHGFEPVKVFFDSFVNIFLWVLLVLTVDLIVEKVRARRYIEQIEKERAANELNFLRAQFNPHFLFNSINSIYAHIDKSNKEARHMLLVFSEMLRYQLYECNAELINLDREVKYIRNYIELQKSRIDERLEVTFCSTAVDGNLMIPPLLLITFIENAFKYVGFNESAANKVEIKLAHSYAELVFTVLNTKDGFVHNHAKDSSGLGIANAKRRLELLYPGTHTLVLNDAGSYFQVELKFAVL